ncbi:MAG TPA: coproporphyrinogen-III oxidase family protein [Candidatus Limnocylindria bacterium]|nr:coproporphyrinogen-III oxidase family protein [Candidatus Limnocylindria bacterium]
MTGAAVEAETGLAEAAANPHVDPRRATEWPPGPAIERPPLGLYLHVPFCISYCPYCDFVVVAGRQARGPESRLEVFVEALAVELELRADALDTRWGAPGARSAGAQRSPAVQGSASVPGARRSLDTLYLGGGTPSLLPSTAVARLIEIVRSRFGLALDAEVTLEANPGPDERGDAAAFRAAGVTRLSIGAQSMETAELRLLGRRHGPADVAAAVSESRAAGIESISIDLLYDIPNGSLDRWSATLDAVLALEPDHLSLYALTLDDPEAEGITGPSGDHLPTPGGARRWRERARPAQDDDRAATMYELADDRLGAAGFEWYEISNWARPGHRSRHNLGYWQGSAWEAAGPGAHAFDGVTRRWNAARLDAYLAALLPGAGAPPSLPPGGAEPDVEGRPAEAAMLALRTNDGLPAAALADPGIGSTLEWAMTTGLVDLARGRLRLTRRGRLLSNEVFTRLL